MGKNKLLIYALFALFINLLLAQQLEQKEESINRLKVTYKAEKKAEILKSTISSYIFDTKLLEVFLVKADYHEDFKKVAHELYNKHKSIKAIQLAPNGIIEYSYPYEENKAGMFNLFSDPKEKKRVEHSRDTGKVMLVGPLELRQGGRGLIVRKPVYITNPEGSKLFWGFTTIVLDFDNLMEESKLERLQTENYNYQLTKDDFFNSTLDPTLITEHGTLNSPIMTTFEINGENWYLRVEPAAGWKDPYLQVMRYVFIILLTLFILYSIEKILLKDKIKRELTEEQVLNKCISMLYQNDDINNSISKLLKILCNYYEGDRSYIIEFETDTTTMNITHEWCAEGVNPQIGELNNINSDIIDTWLPVFHNRSGVRIESVKKELKHSSTEYQFFKEYGIHAIITSPLFDIQGKLKGFIGVDNPKENVKNSDLIEKVSIFIADFIDKSELIKKLDILSFSDRLTGVKNYHAYADTLEMLKKNSHHTLGVSFFDINGLKIVNDTHGHEKGDQLIINCADFLRVHFGNNIYRIGGDEFILLYENIDEGVFQEKIADFKAHLEKQDFRLSFGSRWYENSEDIEKKVKDVDQIMYREKFNYYLSQKENNKT